MSLKSPNSVKASSVAMAEEGELQDDYQMGHSLYLKKSRPSHLGHLTRLYKETEELLMNKDRHGLFVKVEQVDSCFASVLTAHQLYVDSLASQVGRHKAEQFLMSVETGKTEFDARVTDYLKTTDQKPSKCLGVSGRQVPSSVSSSSGSLARLKEAQVKKAHAKLKQRQFAEEIKLKRQLLELEMRQKILSAKAEEELAEAEEEVWASSCGASVSQELMDDRQSIKALKSMAIPKVTFNPEAPPFKSKTAASLSKNNVEECLSKQYVVAQSDQIMQGLIAAQREMATAISTSFQLPKQELQAFSGDPKDYWRFMTNFEANMGSVTDSRLKLNYLIQYCGGEAKEAIADCAILEPELGYVKAREILQALYGQPHVISRTYIDELVKGPPIRPNDSKGLSQLGLLMQRCQITLALLGYGADMDNSENLLRIVRRLPMHVRARWADIADSIIESGREPGFVHLTEFVQNRARVANNVYGKDLNEFKPSEQKLKGVNKLVSRTFTTHATASEVVPGGDRVAGVVHNHTRTVQSRVSIV